MTVASYNPRTEAGLDFYVWCNEVARDTGRLTFGQLWVRDPTADDVMYAVYAPSIIDALNTPTPLSRFFGGKLD